MVQPLEARRVLAASLGWDGPGQGSAELTYYIANSPDSLSQEETNAAIETALAAWSSAADITFTSTNQSGLRDSIDITFTNIDGVGGTLAQAYFPDDVNPARIAGDIEFDLADAWEVGNSLASQAFDLVYVAVHELGHSLGLDHADSLASVLAPFVSPNQFFTTLSAVDAAAVQEVYAAADVSVVDETPVTDTPVDETPTEDTPTNETPTEETPTEETPTTETPTDETPGDDDTDDDLPDEEDDPFPRRRWRRGGNWRRWGGRLESATPEHNYVNPTDVNGDNTTTAVDALMIINQLNLGTTGSENVEIAGLCDTNGDGSITALDALTVINALNSSSDEAASAVSESIEVPDVFDDTLDIDEDEVLDEEESLIGDEVDDEEINTPVDEVDEMEPSTDETTDDVEDVDDLDDTDVIDEPSDEADDTDDDSTDEMIDDGGLVDESDDGLEDETEDGETSDEETDEETGEEEIGDEETDEDETSEKETSDEETDDEDEDEDNCHEGVGHHHHHRFGVVNVGLFGGDAESLITRFDTDDDGSLTEEEVSDRVWAKLTDLSVDTDADGIVTLAELETAIDTARQEAFDTKDVNADGVLSEDEVSERFWNKISDADTDSVEGVSLDELDAFYSEQAAERVDSAGEFRHRHRVADEVFASIGRAQSSSRATAFRFGRGR
ncbi:Peptidase M10A and M12B, matrixin and adamalysin domain protein [Rhodopirellula sp. SWK7]|nr:Peptidase M10A and M12B, matrixin and adamalysin domain protein [Rhodopirellula sp. SWK7]